MVGAVMVDGITPQIAQAVYIPCGVVRISVKAVTDIAAGNLLVSHAASVP